jgi:hypothetical protein
VRQDAPADNAMCGFSLINDHRAAQDKIQHIDNAVLITTLAVIIVSLARSANDGHAPSD